MKDKKLNNKGVTLVEVMVALVILLIVFMGLLQASLLSIQTNMRNALRDEAVRLTSETMTELTRSVAFGNMVNSVNVIPRNFRRNIPVNFTVTVNILALDVNTSQITITTNWLWQNEPFQHQIVATRRR